MIASRDHVIAALRNVFDPEFGMSVVDLGLIRAVQIDGGCVSIAMTLTTRACPLGEAMAQWVREAVRRVEDVEEVRSPLPSSLHGVPDQVALRMRP
jgi:metal-sulfur cluster biosynthetic enzyme